MKDLSRLERSALKRATARLTHLGETVLDFDIATLDMDRTVRLDLLATDRALYLVDSRRNQPARIPYESIASVFWDPANPLWRNRFFVQFFDGQSLHTTIKRGTRQLGAIVRDAVANLTVEERHIQRADGHGATFSRRPIAEGGDLVWWLSRWDQGTEPDDELVSWARSVLEELAD